MVQMKEQIKAPEKIQLSDEETSIQSDAEFKTLVIRMLTEMVEYGRKMEEKVKAMKSELKENAQGTNREGKIPALKSMVWTRRKKQTFNQNRMKKQEFKQNEERLRNLQDNFKCSNIQIIGVPECEEEEQEIEHLFENIIRTSPIWQRK